jgi:hypothetical protein
VHVCCSGPRHLMLMPMGTAAVRAAWSSCCGLPPAQPLQRHRLLCCKVWLNVSFLICCPLVVSLLHLMWIV